MPLSRQVHSLHASPNFCPGVHLKSLGFGRRKISLFNLCEEASTSPDGHVSGVHDAVLPSGRHVQVLQSFLKVSPGLQRKLGDVKSLFGGQMLRVQKNPMPLFAHLQRLQS